MEIKKNLRDCLDAKTIFTMLLNRIRYIFASPKISKEDVLKIKGADWVTLVDWWDKLNTWKWPDNLLPDEDPDKSTGNGKSRRSMLMALIEDKVGMKFILRQLNLKGGMSEEEFEDFWITQSVCN